MHNQVLLPNIMNWSVNCLYLVCAVFSFNDVAPPQSSMWLLNKKQTNEIEADLVWLATVHWNPSDGPQVRGEGMKTGKWMIIEEANYISVSN